MRPHGVHVFYEFDDKGYLMILSDPVIGEELRCKREPGNSSDPYAVAVKKQISGEYKIVGHVPS